MGALKASQSVNHGALMAALCIHASSDISLPTLFIYKNVSNDGAYVMGVTVGIKWDTKVFSTVLSV